MVLRVPIMDTLTMDLVDMVRCIHIQTNTNDHLDQIQSNPIHIPTNYLDPMAWQAILTTLQTVHIGTWDG